MENNSKTEIFFTGEQDRYGGITVDSQKEPCDSNTFLKQLTESLNKWSSDKRRCIWFKVNIKDADWVPILAKEGFNFHNSRENFVMMYKWLPRDCSQNLPPGSHTNVGVGGMVFNNKNQILAVSEHHYEYPHWKLPGGYVERGEDLKDAAIREVKEETGIDATFESMVTFRHTHNMMFGNSDIYAVLKLRATSENIEKSVEEIKACQWMDIDEFLNHPHVHEFNRFLVRQALDLEKQKVKLDLENINYTIGKTLTRDITALVIKHID